MTNTLDDILVKLAQVTGYTRSDPAMNGARVVRRMKTTPLACRFGKATNKPS